MTLNRLPVTALILATVLATAVPVGLQVESQASTSLASDSALDEFRAGRFWHAARILQAEGVATGAPSDVLTLAHAEAGWKNWPAVSRLLADATWIDTEDAGSGLLLLGRAQEDAERWTAAAEAYDRYLAVTARSTAPPTVSPTGSLTAPQRRSIAAARRARVLWRGGDIPGALQAVGAVDGSVALRSWVAVGMAADAAEGGDTATVRALSPHFLDPAAHTLGWRLPADARMAAGDSVGAARAFAGAYAGSEGIRRATAAAELGRLRLAGADTVAARPLLLEGFENGRGAAQAKAAAGLMDIGGHDRDFTLELARVLDRTGDSRRGLRGYDRAARLSAETGSDMPEWARLERARLMGTVPQRREAALDEFRAIRETTNDERIGSRNLELWTQLRRRQGQTAQASTLRRWLLDEYPGSAEAAEVLWARASSADGEGRLTEALALYSTIADNAGDHARAGQSRMRAGQIYLGRADGEAAAEVFEAYLTDFPTGRRWQEAAYWAGRVRMEQDDTARARRHIGRLLSDDPVSYYSVLGAALLGQPYAVDVPPGQPVQEPAWLSERLTDLDLLDQAGLDQGAAAVATELTEAARTSPPLLLTLAEALVANGRALDGINLGWELREGGHAWDQRLLRVAYPFPYRDLVIREAKEWGVDPIIMASIIRQESAFDADIVSDAGAVGLMQVMPPTGAELARAHGPDGFREANLTAPEVNLHLGAAYFRELYRRYDGDLPLVLSAYNAGPSRATRWRNFPEHTDPTRFAERIPFEETRGYVKNVSRNFELYRLLYGAAARP